MLDGVKNYFSEIVKRFRTGYGIYIDTKEIYVTKIVSDLHKAKILQSEVFPLGDKKIQDHLKNLFPNAKTADELLEEAARLKNERKKKGVLDKVRGFPYQIPEMVDVGIKDTAVFYYAFSSSVRHEKTLDIDSIISENPKAEFLHSPQLIYDWTNLQLKDQNFVLICAAQKKMVQTSWGEFDNLNMRPVRVEAGPFAALRAAWYYQTPNIKQSEIRILFGPEMCFIGLSMGYTAIAWQLVPYDPAKITISIFPVVQSFMMYTRQMGLPPVGQIVLQGQDITDEAQKKLAEMTNAPSSKIVVSPPYDGKFISFGLALGALKPETKSLNLSKAFQKPISLISTFPYMESLVSLGIILLTVSFMYAKIGTLQRTVNFQNNTNAQTFLPKELFDADDKYKDKPNANPQEKEQNEAMRQAINNDDLETLINKINSSLGAQKEFYASSHISWTSVLEELSGTMSSNIKLLNIEGKDALWTNKEVGIFIRILAKSSKEHDPETEIKNFLDALKDSKLKTMFPKVTLLSATPMQEDAQEYVATISLSAK